MRPEIPAVEFVYEQSCPFVRGARRRLLEGFRVAGLTPRWTEWEVSDPCAPAHVRGLGSPTILVDGWDIAGSPGNEAANCCRIYAYGEEPLGVPPLEMVVAALTVPEGGERMMHDGYIPGARVHAAVLPAIGLAALPKLTCPVCWPAYAGLLGSFGIGFVNYTPYLLPLTAVFLVVSVLALAYRAPRRRGYGPFLLGAFAAAAVLIGKFGFDSNGAMWAGLGALVVASAWNSWPRRRRDATAPDAACGVCAGVDGARA